MGALDEAMPALWDRGVLTARPLGSVQRWHFILEDGDVIALEIHDDDTAAEVLRRFEDALAGRLLAGVCRELERG